MPHFVVPLGGSKADVEGAVVAMVAVAFEAMLKVVGVVVKLVGPPRPAGGVSVADAAVRCHA